MSAGPRGIVAPPAFVATRYHDGMVRRLGLFIVVLASDAACNTMRDCVPAPGSEPDYADPTSWACRPDVDGDACDIDLRAVEVLADGSARVVPHVPAGAPQVDCFYIYPTVDLRLGAGLHDDLDDRADQFKTVGIQAARFGEVCRVFAPLYRQVTLGTYSARERVREACFDVAYEDVLAAFEHYLEHDNEGRGFVLLGHSQGAQIASRLLRERIEGDAGLRARLVVAAPVGWSLGTDAGGLTGGSFSVVPVCRADDELGCALGYRSYAAGNDFPVEDDERREGVRSVCVHPGDVAGGGPAPLSRSYFPADMDAAFPAGVAEMAPFVLYRDLYEAECVDEGDRSALQVRVRAGDGRVNPIDFEARLVSGTLGTHIYDYHFGLGDLIDQVGIKIAAYTAK